MKTILLIAALLCVGCRHKMTYFDCHVLDIETGKMISTGKPGCATKP